MIKMGKYKRLSRRKGFAWFTVVLLAVVAVFIFNNRSIFAWTPESNNCPPGNSGRVIDDNRCHRAYTQEFGYNSTTDQDGNTYRTTVSRGELLSFEFRASHTSASTGTMPARTMLNWVNINGSPTLRNGVESLSGGTQVTDPDSQHCLRGREMPTGMFGTLPPVYHCGGDNGGAGRVIYSFQNLPAGSGGGTDTVRFNIRISNSAQNGAKGCLRFHTAFWNVIGRPGYSGSIANLIQQQQNEGPTGSGEWDIFPVVGITRNYCYTVVYNPPDNPQPAAACSTSSYPASAWLGQNAQVDVNFTNPSSSTDWWVGGGKSPFPSGYDDNPTNEPPSPPDFNGAPYNNRYKYSYPRDNPAYPNVLDDGLWRTKQHSGVLFSGNTLNIAQQSTGLNHPSNTSRLAQGQTTGRSFVVTSSSIGPQTYYFGISNDESGELFGTPGNDDSYKLCSATINWMAGSINAFNCTDTSINFSPNSQYELRFSEHPGGASWTMGIPAGNSGSYNSSNTFGDFNYWRSTVNAPPMLPHNAYYIAVYVHTGGSWVFVDDASLVPCMTANCQGSIATATQAEPGETISATFGIRLINATNQAFNGYSGRVTASGGLSISGTSTDADTMTAGPSATTNLNGPFNIVANYTGSMTAHLYYGNASIDDIFNLQTSSSCTDSYTPQTRPTFKVKNGDVSVGGGLANSAGQCPTNSYISPFNSGNNYAGGIRAFSRPDSFSGSGADFGVIALGMIDGTGGGPKGFYGSNARQSAGATGLTFSNTTGGLGGLLGGELRGANCADFSTELNKLYLAEVIDTYNGIDISNLTNGSYLVANWDNSAEIQPHQPIPANRRFTFYVRGNIVISRNLTYQSWGFNMANRTNNAPYVTFVAIGGDIYIHKNVDTVNGLFIALPDASGNRGAFVTCTNSLAIPGLGRMPTDSEVTGACRERPLTINGAVVAQRVYNLRSQGTLRDGTTAETYNFMPSVMLGTPFMEATNTDLNGIYNLPPIF